MKLATRCLWGRLSTVTVPLRHQTRRIFSGLLALFALGGTVRAQDFQITTLTASNAVVVEVNGVVGDDRGGIAVSTSQAFLSGDGDTARFNRDTLGSSVGLGVVRDSLCANLRDGTVYLLGNGSTPIGNGGGTVTTLIQLDGTTGAVTTNVLTLSTSISFSGSSSSMGIFSGWDRIVLHNSTRVYRISLPSGTVTDLGAMGVPQRTSSESWAYWGVAENVGSDTYIVCVRNSTTIERTKVPSGPTTTVATFNNLSDMASFTVAPALGRWYFHHESGSQFGSFSESLGYATATFVTPASAPEIVVQPVAQSVIETEPVSFSVSANGTAPLAYQWRKDGSAISGATNNLYSIASVALADAGNFSVVVTNSAGSVTSSVVALTVSSLDAYQFKILSLKTNNFVVTDPLNYVGDDRGGLIATDQKVFLRGDDSVGSVNFDLSGGTRVGTNTGGGGFSAYTYDSLVSDLRSQKAYVLANGSTVLGVDGGTVTTLMEIHGTNGVPTGTNITLSSSIVLPSGGLYSAKVGIFSGWGRILLHNDTNAYVINTTDGSVTNLGAMTRPTRQASESWAYWGVAEYWGGSHYMVYARDAQTIVRAKIPDGTTTVVSTFNNLYDMASFTVVPHLSRWYFHDETINQFTNYGNYGAEILGYADSTLLFQPATIGSQPQNLTVTVGSNATLSVTATPVSPAFTLTYQWKKNGVPISGATNATLVFSSAQLGDSGTYSVSVGGGGSPVESTSATLTVLPNAAPVFTVPGTVTINEDAATQTNYVTAIGPGAAHETNQTLTVTASSSATNLTGPLTVSYAGGTASISYTPVADAFGSATLTVIVADSGGTASGGVDRATNSYTVNVTSVNDPPSATLLTNNVVVLEDSGAYSAAILSSISAGPANEGQTVSITTTNNNAALFASNPAISAAGVLTFTPATNANGSATVTYVLSDSMANVTNTFTLTVTAVNDIPVANAQSVTNLEDIAFGITLTGSDVENSPLTYTVVTGPTNGVLTGTAPNLTYTPTTNFFGGDSFTFKVNDGTVDSAAATISLSITAVNDAPSVAFATNSVVVLEDSGANTASNFAAYVTGPANEAGQAITNVLTSNDNTALFSAAPSVGTNGTLAFTPAAHAYGSATVTVIAEDDGGTSNGGINRTTNTFTLTVLAVNDAPTVTLLTNNVVVLEDSGGTTVSNFAAYVTGPANEAGQAITNVTIVSVTNSALFSSGPTLGIDGMLTFTPATNANGTALVTFAITDDGGTANGGVNTSASVAFLITVTPVNDVPGFAEGADQVVLEDAGAVTVPGWATGISTGPTNESAQSLAFNVSNNSSNLFGVQPAIATNGTLTFTPAANAFGTATVTVTLSDDGGTANSGADTSAAQTFVITVTGVNDAPTVTLLTNNVVVLEDSGANTVTNFAAYVTGPANESGQAITNVSILSVTNSALFSTGPTLGTDGTLTFTPAANANGTALVNFTVTDDGGTANSGVNTSASVAFLITITPVNDAPSIVFATNNYVVLEDSGANTVSNFAAYVTGPANESGQVITNVTTSNDNASLFSVPPVIGTNGTLTFTSAANANGSAVVTVVARDDGGIENGGVNLTTNTFTLTVTGVNDAPSIAFATNNYVVLEDSGANAVSNFAAYVTGPANEAGQAITNVTTSNDNASLFSVPPGIGTNGTLTFVPAAHANGSATVTVVAQDDGGTENGGVNFTTNTFTLTVLAVNDAPTVTLLTNNLVVLEDSGASTVTNFGTFSTGPANESGQAITNVTILSVTNSALFSAGPAVGTDGTLTFTPTANANGMALVTFTATDDGGTANGGVNTSANVAFLITVTPVNDAPTVTLLTNNVVVLEDSGGNTISNFAAYATGPANESGQTITNVSILSVTNSGLFSAGPALGMDGTLTFTPTANANGTALVTFAVTDDGGTENGGVSITTNTFTLTVTGVNDAPSIAFATNSVVVLEDSGASSISNFAAYATGPANESGQAVTNVVISSDNAALFSVAPGVGTNGTLTFTPAANANGSATVTVITQDDGGTDNGGVNLATNTFTLTVLAVNDAPSFTLVTNSYTVSEDTGAQTILNAVINIVAGPADEAAQTVSFEVNNNASNLFSAQPAISGAGTLTFTPAANANGSVTVTVTARDNGGTDGGGVDASAPQVITIVLAAVNDAPAVVFLTNSLVVLEDAGAQTVTNFVAFTQPGDEAGQSITNLIVSNNNANLFSAQPTVGTNGMLTFTAGANAYGSALVTVIVQDDGGTANGGVDLATNTFTITVTAVNDAPAISFSTNHVLVIVNSGAFSADGFATLSTGPANESGQSITNIFAGNNNNALFSAPPAIGTDGTLTFTPALNASGSALVTVIVQDDGGTENGGVSLVTNTFTLTVDALPTVALTNPAPNSVFTAPATIALMADASDSDGSIARVEFLSGTSLLATDTNAPYQFALTSVAPGRYVFSAVATDDQSLSATSAPVSVLVNYPVSLITNLALNQAATQSSTTSGGFAEKANDGNTNGAFGGSSVSHTEYAFQSWWEVDLGGVYGLAEIEVFNRTDCCGERLSNFHVLVSDAPFSASDLTTVTNQAGVSSYYFSGMADASESFPINRTGRYVRIQLAGSGWMSLAEVLVWGSTSTQAWVHLTAPPNGTLIEGTNNPVTLQAVAFFASSPVARVDFFSGNALLGSVTNAPHTFSWTNLTIGTHTLSAQAVDTNGVSIASQPVSITVELPNQAPIVNAGADQIAFFPVTTNANAIIRPPGKIFINNDEWTLSNPGYTNCPVGADLFARKLAAWFTGGQPGNFLAYSEDFGLVGTSLAATMVSAGHTWTVSRSVSFTLTNLLQYDAVFLARQSADNQVLIDYVNAGGNVFIAAGTAGVGDTVWNPFLNYFGLNFSATLNGLNAVLPVSSTHPALAGVPSLYFQNGNLLNELNPANPNTDAVYHTNNLPLFASYQNTFSPIILGGQVTDDLKPNGSVVTQWWSKASGPPSGDAFFSNTNALTNRVVFSAPGTYILRLTATDGVLTNSDEVQIIVNPNQAPLVEAGQPITLRLPNDATLNGSLFDDGQPDGAPLTSVWSLVTGPGNVTFADASLTNTTATFTNTGLYTLRLTANDTQLQSTDSVLVIVLPPQNYAPTANAGPDLAVVQPNSVSLNGTATDDGLPAGSTLTAIWSRVTGPGQVIFTNGTNSGSGLTNAASFTAAGTYVLRLTVSDGELAATDDLTVTVYSQSTTNQPPVVNAGPDQSIRLPNASVSLVGTAGDDGLPIGGTLTSAWSLVSGPASVTVGNASALSTTATFTQSGLYVLRLTVNDSDLSASDDVAIRVYDPITGAPPTVLITSPVDGTNVTAPTAIRGNVSTADWVLEYALGGDDEPNRAWTTLSTGTGPVANAVLGTLDSTLLLNGVYSVRLTATDSSGQITEDEITVLVDRNLKVGQFAFSFNDLTVPVAGIPITITRSYDSRDKRVGDFGVGWTMDLQNIRLQKNRHLGRAWTQTSTGGDFPVYAIPVQQNKPRLITITFPNGKAHKFGMAPTPAASFVFPIEFPTAQFVPFSDTKGTLTPVFLHHISGERIVDDSLIFPTPIPGTSDLISYELLIDPPPGAADNILFNPDLFEFKSAEGYTYLLSATNGLRKLTDPSGNTLTFTTNGILSSAGKSVTFDRDALGRITNIVDAAGQAMRYVYDTNGNLAQFIDREGNTNSFTYDGRHNLLAATDARGITPALNTYDTAGRLTQHTDAFGQVIAYTHDIPGRREVVRDRLGRDTVHIYDDNGNVLSTTAPDGGQTLSTYDANDNLLTVTDPLGRTTTYRYDAQDNRTNVVDALGNSTSLTYGDKRRVTSVTDSRGNTITNTFDATGNLLVMRDPLGNTVTFGYNSKGQPTAMTNALNHVTTWEYNATGYLTRETDPTGRVNTYTNDNQGNPISLTTTRTTPAGPQTLTLQFAYDALNRLTNAVYPDGTSTRTVFNAIGKPAVTIDQLGRSTSRDYDELGRVTRVTYADSTSDGSTYDAEGRLFATTNRLGRVTRYHYDVVGRMNGMTAPDGVTTTNYFDVAGQLLVSTDARGNNTFYGYDGAGRTVAVTNALGQVSRTLYDAAGNVTNAVDALGRATTFIYDALNRRTQTLFTNGTTQSVFFDALGRRTAATDQAGVSTWFGYDALGRLTSVTNALLQVTRYAFNEVGQLVTQTDANNHATTYEYDQLGRRTKRTLPGGQFESFGYDTVGNLASRTDANGFATTYFYDTLNRLLSRVPDARLGQTTVAFTYNALGQRTVMTDASGTTTYAYDLRNRLTTKATPQGTLGYGYDAAGNLTNLVSGNVNGTAVVYEYDALNRLSAVNDSRLGRTTYSYDAVGNLESFILPNNVHAAYQYDSLNRLTNLAGGKTVTALANYAYTVGAAGNRLAASEQLFASVLNPVATSFTRTWEYDALYRLTNETVQASQPAAQGALAYSYDPVGNRLARYSTMAALLGQSFSFDANDRLTGDSYDANGNTTYGRIVTGGAMVADAYDFEDRLVNRNNGQVTLGYDGDGNRVRKTVGGVTTWYLVDTLNPTGYAQVVEEISNAGGPAEVSRTYTWGHSLLLQDQLLGTNWTASFYGYDGHGSVRYLTDGAGQVTDTFDYDAFGNLVARTGTTPNLYLFTGQQFDPDLGLYYLRARYHNPDSGRFWTADAFEGFASDPQSLHRYTYCANDPVNCVDPSGYSTSLAESTTVMGIGVNTRFLIGTLSGFYTGGALGAVESYRRGGNAVEGFTTGALSGALFGGLLGPVPASFWASTMGQATLATLTTVGLSQAAVSYTEGYEDLALLESVFAVSPYALTSRQLTQLMSWRYLQPTGHRAAQSTPSSPITDPARMLPAPSTPRQPRDMAVNPTAPAVRQLSRPIGGTPAQQRALTRDIQAAIAQGATDIRVNQQQVNALGQRVGINRPDLQYTLPGRRRVYVEYDNATPATFPNSPRGRGHADRILANDPDGVVQLQTF